MVRVGLMRFDALEPPHTSASAPNTLRYLCDGVVREGSLRFDVLEPFRTSTVAPYTPCYLFAGVDREGSMRFDVFDALQCCVDREGSVTAMLQYPDRTA